MVNSPTFVGRARRSEPIPNDFAGRWGWDGWCVSETLEGLVTSLSERSEDP